jgi:hypothetical protein
MRSKSNQANERNVSIEKRILSWHDNISQYGASNYPTLARLIRIMTNWYQNGMVGADDEWCSQHENGYALTTPKDAPHHDGYCWIYAIVHKNQHDGLYVGRTTLSLYDRFKQHATGHPKRTD